MQHFANKLRRICDLESHLRISYTQYPPPYRQRILAVDDWCARGLSKLPDQSHVRLTSLVGHAESTDANTPAGAGVLVAHQRGRIAA